MDEQIDIDRIESYLLNRLSPEEQRHFEEEIRRNASLKEQVEIYRLALSGLSGLQAADLADKFRKWEKEGSPDTYLKIQPAKISKQLRYWYWTVAVLLIILLLMAVWYYIKVQNRENGTSEDERRSLEQDSVISALQREILLKQSQIERLEGMEKTASDSILRNQLLKLQGEYDLLKKGSKQGSDKGQTENELMAMAAAPDEKHVMRGILDTNRSEENPLNSAIVAFDKKNYTRAIALLKDIDPNDVQGQRMALYLLPYALFYAGQYGEASLAFEDLSKIEKAEADKVEWFLLLCYIAEDRKNHIKNQLSLILKNPQHQFYDQAVEMEKRLTGKKIIGK